MLNTLLFFRLECQVGSYQSSPLISWFVNGIEIKPSPHYEIQNQNGKSILLIIQVAPQDTGEYTCKAVTDVGEALSSTTLYVQGWWTRDFRSSPDLEVFESKVILAAFLIY